MGAGYRHLYMKFMVCAGAYHHIGLSEGERHSVDPIHRLMHL